MPSLTLPVGLAISSLLFCTPSSAQKPGPPRAQSHPVEAVDQEQFVAYWTLEAGWGSELQLRNNMVSGDLTVTPALRSADGVETALAPVTIHPQEIKMVDLESASLASAPQYLGTYGSVVLRYHSTGNRNLFAMLMIHDRGHSIAFHIDATGEDQDMASASREGIWWLPNDAATDQLVVTNQSARELQADLSLYDSAGREAKQKLALPPRSTTRLSVRQLVRANGLSGTFGGVRIFAPSHGGSIDSMHLLFDETTSFSAFLKMFNHSPKTTLDERDFAHTKTWTLRAPMLALSQPDPALAFPEGTTLQPQLFVHNTMGKPVDVNLRFAWRSAISTGKVPGPSFRLGAFETQRVDVAALQASNALPKDGNWTSVVLTTNGLPEEVVALAASYDKTLRYGAQTPFSDQLAFEWVGSLWEYDVQHNSLITAGNGGTKPIRAGFTIYYNGGTQKYELERPLQPDEQMWIDVGKLIREQVPDKNGKLLPQDLTSGSYQFRDLSDKSIGSLYEGKIVYDKTFGHVTYGCANCCAYGLALALWYDPLGIPFQSTSGNGADAYDSCTGLWDDVSDYAYGNWTTSNSSIATVDYYGTHTGRGVGSATSSTSALLQISSIQVTCPVRRSTGRGNDNVTPSFAGILTASDNFSGRSTTSYGIQEIINLSFVTNPTGASAASLGGLQWSIVSGGGTLTASNPDGTGTYTAPATSATVVLKLTVATGTQMGTNHTYSITIVPPNGAYLVKYSNIHHTQGFISVGFLGHIYLTPTNVSFARLKFQEGTATAIGTGYFAPENGLVHPVGSLITISGCNVSTGCLAGNDTVNADNYPPPFSTGDFAWNLPWKYQNTSGALTTFTTVTHHLTAAASGLATIEKAGAGPYSKLASDPSSSY